jgi:hypothetical protein
MRLMPFFSRLKVPSKQSQQMEMSMAATSFPRTPSPTLVK